MSSRELIVWLKISLNYLWPEKTFLRMPKSVEQSVAGKGDNTYIGIHWVDFVLGRHAKARVCSEQNQKLPDFQLFSRYSKLFRKKTLKLH